MKRINEDTFWIILIFIFALLLFYNPYDYSKEFRITWLLLCLIGYQISMLNFAKGKENERK